MSESAGTAGVVDFVMNIIPTACSTRVPTPNTHTDPDALIIDLGVIRQRGYAIDEGEQGIGLAGVLSAAAVWTRRFVSRTCDEGGLARVLPLQQHGLRNYRLS